jgi:hypothetical protein
MRTKCQSIATFHRPIHSHWSLPLTMVFKVLVTLRYSVLKIIRVNAEKTKYLGKF